MKKQSDLSRLTGYAGRHRILTYLSWILSVISALLALVPFWYIWRIVHDILEVFPDFSQAKDIISYGWSAVAFAVLSIIVYIAALMCSHISAFRIASNIRKELLRHIASLPLGVTEKYGSGWCVLNWHGVKESYTYFSRTGTSEGMTATPLSAKTYGDLWIAYRRPPEGEEGT